jgi:hypothetical protein
MTSASRAVPGATRHGRQVRRVSALDLPRAPQASRRPLILFALALGLAIGGRAAARFYAPDPTSPLYETTALVAGKSMSVSGAQVTGDLRSNGNIQVGDDSRVTGNAAASGQVEGRQRISGTVQQGVPPIALPKLPTAAEARAMADRVFSRDTTFTDARIDDVVFVGGDVRVRGSLNGTGSIVASGDIVVEAPDDSGHGGDDRGGSTQQVHLDASTRLSLVALGDLRMGQGRALRGLLVARQTLELAGKNQFDGVVVALGALRIDEGSVVRFVKLDRTPPVLSSLAPADASLLATATPAISGQLADDLSGVDPTSFKLTLDGVDRSAATRVSAATFDFTPAVPLADGAHTVTATVADHAGNLAQARWSFTTDITPPSLAITSPGAQVAAGSAVPITVAYADATSGLDLGSLRVSLDGADLTASCTAGAASASCSAAPPALGSHGLAASVRDRAGNAATATSSFQVVAPAPTITILNPKDRSFTRTPSVHVTGTFTGQGASVTVNGLPAAIDGKGGFAADVVLTEGLNPIVAVVTDAQGSQAASNELLGLDTQRPTLSLIAPTPGSLTNQAQVRFTGAAADSGSGIASVTVAGNPVVLAGGLFDTVVPVAEGLNQIVVRAVDLAGNEQTTQVPVTRFSVPSVSITSPADLSYMSSTTVTVSGSLSGAVAVSVNGVPAVVAGTTFSALGVPLVEGGNTLTATATDARGRAGIASINVVRDLTPPRVAIYTPAAGATVSAGAVTVAGLVNDIVAGTVNAGNVAVTVNGVPARVANRSFLVEGVPLRPGDNTLTAVAVDAAGNQGQASISVRQASVAGPRIVPVTGGSQTAIVGNVLPQPLVAQLLDAAGQPAPGKLVLFRVRGSDGSLDGGKRGVAATTDASGQALAHFTLGTRAGAGNQVVEATAVGFAGPAAFLASALPGPPALIVVDSGDQQLGVAGQALPRPLVAAIVDSGSNRLAGVAATFRVVKGSGHFANGLASLSLTSDSDGRLIVPFVTDPAEAVAGNVVEASIDALPGGPKASFVASTLAAGDPAQTAVSGVVLDNSNLPVAGVTLRIRDTTLTVVTDVQGHFRIAPVVPGTVKLIVDGSTATRPGAWPDLEFDVTTVPGRDNALRMPVYLLPLDLATGVQVDETHGGTLRLPQLPGFALEIQPGSVSFPGGGRSGLVSVTVVHGDKVPMVPNFGQQPRLIVTIQPAGARFDPPARLTLPNVEGLLPGQVTEFYSFDHDLGHFVSIGPGTVSDDGTVVTSNVGVGIVKAGWHCCGFPQGSGAPNHCPDCTDCTGDQCLPRDLCQTCKQSPGSACDGRGQCLEGRSLIPFPRVRDGLGLTIGPRQPLGRGSDPLVDCEDPVADPCFIAVHEALGPVTTNCDSISLRNAILEEVEDSKGFDGCPPVPPIASRGCIVIDGNQLLLLNTGKPCGDTHSICGRFPLPTPGPTDPPKTCTIVNTQTLFLDRVEILRRTITYTLTRTNTTCTVTIK